MYHSRWPLGHVYEYFGSIESLKCKHIDGADYRSSICSLSSISANCACYQSCKFFANHTDKIQLFKCLFPGLLDTGFLFHILSLSLHILYLLFDLALSFLLNLRSLFIMDNNFLSVKGSLRVSPDDLLVLEVLKFYIAKSLTFFFIASGFVS